MFLTLIRIVMRIVTEEENNGERDTTIEMTSRKGAKQFS